MRPTNAATADPRPGADVGHPVLPVIPVGGMAAVRPSRRSRWRAAVLLSVHVAIAAHVGHFMIAGRTISPVEPSESMYTLELGQVNAGFVFFAVALLATAVFGRFFCGWGCHIVALQDLCGWLMKKIGVRPRPFRSRLLAFVPLVLALYMFVWPAAKRVLGLNVAPFPGFTNHLVTDGFWDTFPGPVGALLTFAVCGFAAVYFLGAKGFCTYGCPYGAFFAGMDRLAPGRIVVNDDCEQCGHCTVTCTSNVVVHDEVRRHGMVVSPGCMKCMDCVSVCPKGALRYAFTRPPWLAGRGHRPAAPRAPRGRGWLSEAALALLFGASFAAFYQLYDGSPLLMSAGLAGVTAFVAWTLARVVAGRPTTLQGVALRQENGLTRAGVAFAVLAAIWLSFAVHSGWMQAERVLGRRQLARTAATRDQVVSGSFRTETYPPSHRLHADAATGHFARASRFGLRAVPEVETGLAWGYLLAGRDDEAIAAIRRALAVAPANARLHRDLADLLHARGRVDEAIAAIAGQLDAGAGNAIDRARLGLLLAERGRYPEALTAFDRAVAERPDAAGVRHDLGALLRRMGRPDEALPHLEAAVRLDPDDADARFELGLAHAALGRRDDALRELRTARELGGARPEAAAALPRLIRDLETAGGR